MENGFNWIHGGRFLENTLFLIILAHEQLLSFYHSGHVKIYEPSLSELQFGRKDSIIKPFKVVILIQAE